MADVLLPDPRQLAALVAVVETGTFGAAADELGYTQSAVSQQVAALERVAGASLLVRPGGPRRVSLTPAGEALVVHARAVLARLQAARADLDAISAGDRGTLRVGTMQSVGTKVLPWLLKRFRGGPAWCDAARRTRPSTTPSWSTPSSPAGSTCRSRHCRCGRGRSRSGGCWTTPSCWWHRPTRTWQRHGR